MKPMKTVLPDIQNLKDTRGKFLAKVGIRQLKVPISLKRRSDKQVINTIADVSVYTSLNEEVKGVNMSRYAIVLHEAIKDHIGADIIETLLDKLSTVLESRDSYVKFRFPYFIEKEAPVSKMKGYLDYECTLEGTMINGEKRKYLTVDVNYTSLCPCSKEISQYGAHNQPSTASVKIELKKFVWIEDVVDLVENLASCQIFSVLKRPDEAYVTEHAYENPKFVEDMARDTAVALDKWLDDSIEDYVVVINHFESIHNHVATCITDAGRRLK